MSRRKRTLSWLCLIVGLANLIRGLLALRLWDAALGWSLALPLPLLGGFYFLVGFTFTLSAFLIRFGKGLSFVLPLAVLYQLALWVIRWVGYRSAYARSQWARDLLLTGLFLALVTLLVRSTPSGRAGEEET